MDLVAQVAQMVVDAIMNLVAQMVVDGNVDAISLLRRFRFDVCTIDINVIEQLLISNPHTETVKRMLDFLCSCRYPHMGEVSPATMEALLMDGKLDTFKYFLSIGWNKISSISLIISLFSNPACLSNDKNQYDFFQLALKNRLLINFILSVGLLDYQQVNFLLASPFSFKFLEDLKKAGYSFSQSSELPIDYWEKMDSSSHLFSLRRMQIFHMPTSLEVAEYLLKTSIDKNVIVELYRTNRSIRQDMIGMIDADLIILYLQTKRFDIIVYLLSVELFNFSQFNHSELTKIMMVGSLKAIKHMHSNKLISKDIISIEMIVHFALLEKAHIFNYIIEHNLFSFSELQDCDLKKIIEKSSTYMISYLISKKLIPMK